MRRKNAASVMALKVDWGAHTRLVSYGERSKNPPARWLTRARGRLSRTGLTPQKRALTSPQALCFNPARSRSTFARRKPPEACGSAGGWGEPRRPVRLVPCSQPPAAAPARSLAVEAHSPNMRETFTQVVAKVSCRYR